MTTSSQGCPVVFPPFLVVIFPHNQLSSAIVVPAPRPAALQLLSCLLNPTTTDLELPWPLLHGNGQGKRCVHGRYAIVAIDGINASQNGSDRPTKRPCLGVEDVSFDTSFSCIHYPQHTGVTVQPFIISKPAPFTRSQELPRRPTQDINAPTITLSSSAPSISTSTHCNRSEVLVASPLGDTTGESMDKSSESSTAIPQEDGIGVSESFAIEALEPAPSSPIGPASSCSQHNVVLQSTSNSSQNFHSTLLVFPPTPDPVFGLQEDILLTDGAQETHKVGDPPSINPMDVFCEQAALEGGLEGDSTFLSAAKCSPVYTAVAPAAVVPSVEITLPMDPHEVLHNSLKSPSAPCTTMETKAFIDTQGPPASLSLEALPGDPINPMNSVCPNSTGQIFPKHKLASPFSSPLKSKKLGNENLPPSSPTDDSTTATPDNTDKQPLGQFLLPPVPLKKPEFTPAHLKNKPTHAAKSAFKPPTFKSPLYVSPATPTSQNLTIYPSSSASKKTGSTPIWAPSDKRPATALTIQTLERRLALLKRAINIRSEHEGEERLEDLTRKWKDVARDVSWELWAIVKQNHEDGVGGIVNAGEERGLFTNPRDENGPGGRFRSGWGWDDKDKGESSTDWNPECGEEERPQDGDVEKEDGPEDGLTMSVMLRQLGIAESTLGWEEAEGDFKAD